MSYILDALRRADAERGRGAVPGLHTQAAAGVGASSAAGRPALGNPWLVAAGVVAVAALAAGATWWALKPAAAVPGAVLAIAPETPAPPPAAPVAPAPPATPVMPAPPAAPNAPVPSPVTPSMPALSSVPTPAPAPPAAPRPDVRTVDKRPADKRGSAPPGARERTVAAVVAAPPPVRAPGAEAMRPREPAVPSPAAPNARATPESSGGATPPSSPVYAQADLPETLRTQLPALKVTGATHSNNPVYRMAIVNGQVLHEGDQAAPGLLLERIESGRTIWSFKGYRYAVSAQ